jgi:glycosyltransferase involved in cell wall biosynthesis
VAVDIEETASFRAAVEALLNDPARSLELGKNGRRAVEEKFNWSVEERKLIALYRQLAGHD